MHIYYSSASSIKPSAAAADTAWFVMSARPSHLPRDVQITTEVLSKKFPFFWLMKVASLNLKQQETEKNKAMDLVDALSR